MKVGHSTWDASCEPYTARPSQLGSLVALPSCSRQPFQSTVAGAFSQNSASTWEATPEFRNNGSGSFLWGVLATLCDLGGKTRMVGAVFTNNFTTTFLAHQLVASSRCYAARSTRHRSPLRFSEVEQKENRVASC
jgi:hypothetical protein